jgi:hypothetical protein
MYRSKGDWESAPMDESEHRDERNMCHSALFLIPLIPRRPVGRIVTAINPLSNCFDPPIASPCGLGRSGFAMQVGPVAMPIDIVEMRERLQQLEMPGNGWLLRGD